MESNFRVEPTGQSGGHCACCGNETRTIWGYIYSNEDTAAAYFLQWTRHEASHLPNLDFLIGTWGDDTQNDRKLVAWLYNPAGGSFMAIDADSRPAAKSSLCTRAMRRNEVLSDSEFMSVATRMIDAVWAGDPRIQEVRDLSTTA